MKLTAEQIQENWDVFNNNIKLYITGERKQKLLDFYNQYAERIMLMPAAHKKEYHNAFPGGYVEHVNRVVRCALKQYDLWAEEGADMTTFTTEELVFSAINHDLGKMGDEKQDSYIPQDDKWRREKLGEDYNSTLKSRLLPSQIEVYLCSNHTEFSIHLMKWSQFKRMMVYTT